MKVIDQYAYRSPLRHFDPVQKVLFSLLVLITCLIEHSLLLYITVILLMGWLTVRKGLTPIKLYIMLMLVPLTFLILSLLTLLFDFSTESNSFLWSIHITHMYMGISKGSIEICLFMFFKVFASVSCLYFLCLSTPMNDILRVLEKWHCPIFLLEIMSLIYRFIFVFIDTATTMYTAQVARLGYRNFHLGIRSFGMLLSTLLIRTLKMNNVLYTSLECRGYNGSFNVLHEGSYKSLPYLYLILVEALLIGLGIIEFILGG